MSFSRSHFSLPSSGARVLELLFPDSTATNTDDDWEVVDPVSLPQAVEQSANIRCTNASHSHSHTLSYTPRDDPVCADGLRQTRPSSITMSSEALQQQQSRLFTLPAELRINIYEQVLSFPHGAAMGRRSAGKPSVLSLLQTCRRVLYEAEQIFYTVNRLEVDETPSFLNHTSLRRRSAIRTLLLHVSNSSTMLEAFSLLQQAPNLSSLHVRSSSTIRYMDLSSWTIMRAQLCEALRGLPCLQDLQIMLPEVSGDLTSVELEREEKFNRFVASLQSAVPTCSPNGRHIES